jgi:peptidoglycan/xylan/chitin deacetylase (PgdA/CDA1 family)
MWPDGINCAIAFTFDPDVESAWIAQDPAFAQRPGPLSLARYTPRVAIPLILDLLKRQNIKGTFFTPGKVAEDHPAMVESIVAAGHEIAAHGYTHDPPSALAPDVEQDHLQRTKGILEAFGVEVSGYRAPLFEVSQNTFEFLQRHHFIYSANLMDDIKPYCHKDLDVVELPVSWLMDDWVQFGHGEGLEKHSTCAHVLQLWSDEFAAIYELGGVFISTLHPQVIGRPSRIKMMDEFIDFVKSHEGVWIAPCAEIAKHVRKTLE